MNLPSPGHDSLDVSIASPRRFRNLSMAVFMVWRVRRKVGGDQDEPLGSVSYKWAQLHQCSLQARR